MEPQDLGLREGSPRFKIMELVSQGKFTEDQIADKLGFQHVTPVRKAKSLFSDLIKEDKKGVLSLKKIPKKAKKVKLEKQDKKQPKKTTKRKAIKKKSSKAKVGTKSKKK
jgi:hypothetical protein